MKNQCRPESVDSDLSFITSRPILSLDATICGFPSIKRPLHTEARLQAFDVTDVGARGSVLFLENMPDQKTAETVLTNKEKWFAESLQFMGTAVKHGITTIEERQYLATFAQLVGEVAIDTPGKLRDITDELLISAFERAANQNSAARQLGLRPCYQPSLTTSCSVFSEFCVSSFAVVNEATGEASENTGETPDFIRLLYWLVGGIDLYSSTEVEPPLLSKWSPSISLRNAEILRAGLERKGSIGLSDVAQQLATGSAVHTPSYSSNSIKAPPAIPSAESGLNRVAGMRTHKNTLQREVLAPARDKEAFSKYGLKAISSLLMFGPSGCGKTHLAKALAEELGQLLIQVRPSDVASMYVRETVVRLRDHFNEAIRNAPCVLFYDEFDGLATSRDNFVGSHEYKIEEVNEILTQLDLAKENNVFVIAASNQPFVMDPGVFRSGRFEKIFYIAPPDEDDRVELLEFFMKGRPAVAELDLADFAAHLDGYSAADLKTVVEEAARIALFLGKSPISQAMLMEVLTRVPPSITRDCEKRFEKFIARGYSI